MSHCLLGIHCIVMSQSRNEIFHRAKPTSVMVVPVVQKAATAAIPLRHIFTIYSRDCKHPIKVGTPRMLAPIPAANFESKHRCLLSRFYGMCLSINHGSYGRMKRRAALLGTHTFTSFDHTSRFSCYSHNWLTHDNIKRPVSPWGLHVSAAQELL